MNIKITYNWLREYLDTDADAYELQKYLSLCGAGVERIDEVEDPDAVGIEDLNIPAGKDYVMDIEVTSNRVDMASVFGIAQEATAILPQFGKKAKLVFNPLEKYTFENLNAEPHAKKQLNVEIKDHDLCPRFTAIIYSDVQMKQAPNFMKRRLEWCDVKSINNIVDISNYLMLSLGQPTHMFDYDKIAKHTMIVRASKKGEKLTTLDNKGLTLPGNDIVIEDGEGRLIDLCGIMGGENSEISMDTNTVIFFVQTYNKRNIRKTSMLTGQRTVAATYFEKGLDTERVENTLVYGVDLLNQFSGGIVDSQLIDIYPHPYKPKEITTYLSNIHRVMGVEVKPEQVEYILKSLGFVVKTSEEEGFGYPDSVKFHITVPSYREDDVHIKEDIIEEVARVYGYHNLPNNIQPTVQVKQPHEIEQLFTWQYRVKNYLKHLGMNEVMNYSMISKNLMKKLDLQEESKLKLANTISEEIEYMRNSLVPSLIKNMKDNQGKKEQLKLFELSKVYGKRPNDLPEEKMMLAIAVDTDYFDLKGIIEGLMRELHISNYEFKPGNQMHYSPNVQATLFINGEPAAFLGQLRTKYKANMELKKDIYLMEMVFDTLIKNAHIIPTYQAPAQFSIVKLDMTIKQNPDIPFAQIKENARRLSTLCTNIDVIDIFNENITLRFYFSAPDRNITEIEAKKELETILQTIS